jgi:hypothetical protein
MSLQFNLFPSGTPPADADNLLISRVDVTSPSGFSNYQLTWAELKATVAGAGAGRDGAPGIDGEPVDEPMMIPGVPGLAGAPGAAGITSTTVFFLQPDDPEDVMVIPGARGIDGIAGSAGTNGTNGRDGNTILLEPELPDEPMMIPPPPTTASGGGYNLIEEDGTPLVARTTINFTGAGVTASDVGGETEVNIPGGAGGDLALNKHILTSNFTITAGWAAYITRYLEIAAGVIFEIGADGDMEIG